MQVYTVIIICIISMIYIQIQNIENVVINSVILVLKSFVSSRPWKYLIASRIQPMFPFCAAENLGFACGHWQRPRCSKTQSGQECVLGGSSALGLLCWYIFGVVTGRFWYFHPSPF